MRRKSVGRWVLASCLLAAGSCAPSSQATLVSPGAAYDVVEAEQTLAFGYTSITERYLERVTAATVALEGMRGLTTLAPELVVTRLGGKVLLSASGRLVTEYPAPADDDVRGWARLTLTMAVDARGASSAVREASLDTVYQVVFDATLARLDPFSRYASPKEARDHRASRNGFGGIGIRFELVDGGARLIEVMDGTPAKAAGLKLGDIIVRVGDTPVAGLDREGLSGRLRGPEDSEVALTIRREGEMVETVTLRRALIVPPTVTATLKDGIAEFKIASFNQRTATNLAEALKAARGKLGASMKGVVLDLRGNPGGLLDQAVQMADLFVAHGPIVSTRGRHPLASQFYDARPGDLGESLPVVVLIDGKSASAAEILAGALQDAGRAVVIGTNSYGKGTVQTVIHLPNDGEMTLTWSRFYTPSGYALHGLGVLPALCTADDRQPPEKLLGDIADAKAGGALTAELSEWRAAKLDELERRKRLRAICPGSKHGEVALDLILAERLLGDRAAYGRALALSAPPALPATAGAPLPPTSDMPH